MRYYRNYLNNLACTPNEEYRGLQQAIVSSCFDNTTILTTIEEEQNFDFVFNEIEAWVGTVTDAITNVDKDVRDYRYLYFEDCTHDSTRGKYYKFDNNYWLVYESSTNLESLSNCKCRRCNNKLKWIDKNNGSELSYPCILDYSLSAPSNKITKNINTPNSHVTVIVQGNKNTLRIKKNQRFIFNDEVYKFSAINNYMQTDYIGEDNENVPLLFLDCYLDEKQANDDFKNDIANTDNYNYEIKISEESFEQKKGFKGILNATIIKNGKEVNREVTWKTSNNDIVTINQNGEYELVGNNNEQATITAYIEDGNISSSIVISIKEDLFNKNDIVIEPLIKELRLHDDVNITAFLFKDGVKQSNKVTCIPSGLDEKHYTLTQLDDNTFNLKNNKYSDKPLSLTFKSEDIIETIEINLGAMF